MKWNRLLAVILIFTICIPQIPAQAEDNRTALHEIQKADIKNNDLILQTLKDRDEQYNQEQRKKLAGTEPPSEEKGEIGETAISDEQEGSDHNPMIMEFSENRAKQADEPVSASISGNSQYDLIAKPSFQNKTDRPDLDGRDVSCYVSNYSGDLQLNYEDVTLPGKNGMDLTVSHFYNSEQGSVDYYNDDYGDFSVYPNTYYLQRYGLGLGWSFGFPSVQVISSETETEMYYHTGDGAAYHVDRVNSGCKSKLDNYYANNVLFSENDTSYTRGTYKSAYSFKRADNTMEYFSKTGEVLAIEDRYGNAITFDYSSMPGESLLPYDSYNTWTYGSYWSKPTIRESDKISEEDNYLTWNYSSSGSGTATTSFSTKEIELEKDAMNYYASLVYDAKDDGDKKFSGTISIWATLYDQSHRLVKTTQPEKYTPTQWNQTVRIEQDFKELLSAVSYARYAKLHIQVENGKNRILFDDIRFSPMRNMISSITDTVGRTLDFQYTGDPYIRYENISNTSFPIKISIRDPEGVVYRTLTFYRSIGSVINRGNGTKREIGKFFFLMGSNNDDVYSEINYSVAYPSVEDNYKIGRGSCTSNNPSVGYGYYFSDRPIINSITHRNSATYFEYENVRKKVGSIGFIDTVRVSRMYEKAVDKGGGWDHTILQDTHYTYNKGSFNDETRYGTSSTSGYYVVEETDASGKVTTWRYKRDTIQGNMSSKKIETDLLMEEIIHESSDGTSDAIAKGYTYSDPYAITSPSKIQTTTTTNGKQNVTYQKLSYDSNTSEVISESMALTEDEAKLSYVSIGKYTSYQYKKIDTTIHGIVRSMYLPCQTYYYQDEKNGFSEKWNYDDMGNVILTEDAEGNQTEYTYENETYPWMVTKESVVDPERKGDKNRKAEILYEYEGDSCYGFGPTKITEKNGDGISGIKEIEYEPRYGKVSLEKVQTGEQEQSETWYEYEDKTGLCTRVVYPPYRDTEGENHYLEESCYYPISPIFYNNEPYREVITSINQKNRTNNLENQVDREISYYDDYGNLVYTDSYSSGKEEYQYDTSLRVTAYRNDRDQGTKNNTLTYQYDGLDRITEVTDRVGNKYLADYQLLKTEYAFQEKGSDEKKNRYDETMDIQGQIIRETYYDGTTAINTEYTYDFQGNILSVTDGNGKKTAYEYNKLNEPVKIVQADGSIIETRYNMDGNPTDIMRTYEEGTSMISNAYDERGQLREISQKGSNISVPEWSYTYRPDGLLSRAKDPNGNIRSYEYDASGNQILYQNGSRGKFTYYNEYLRPSKIVEFVNGSKPQTIDYIYDYKQQLTKKTVDGEQIEYSYDDHYRLTGITAPYQHDRWYDMDELDRIKSVSTENQTFWCEYTGNGLIQTVSYPTRGLKTTYTYDDRNRLIEMKTVKDSDIIVEYQYTYDNVGNVLSVSGSENIVYTYDDLYRLKTVRESGVTTTYEYDGRNNLVSETTSKGKSKNYEYSGDNRLEKTTEDGITVTYEYDLNGNLIGDSEGNEYAYDEDNRMIYSNVDGVETTYTIGAEGYRTQKKIGNTVTNYYLDESGHVITETDGDGGAVQMIWNGRQAIARKDKTGYYYYIYNGHGDVVALINEEGAIVNSYTYDPWGKQTVKKKTVENPLGYGGEYQDRETGLTYLRARYYSPDMRRFVQEDPARDQWDWYVYCYNNPIKYIDYDGNMPVEAAESLINSPQVQNIIGNIIELAKQAGMTVVDYVAQNYSQVEQAAQYVAQYGEAAWDWAKNKAAPWVKKKINQGVQKIKAIGTKIKNKISKSNQKEKKEGFDNVSFKNQKKKTRIDVERGGSGKYNIHYHDGDKKKYIYDEKTNNFYDSKGKKLSKRSWKDGGVDALLNRAKEYINKMKK